MEYVVQTFGLSKKYGKQMCVDRVNLNIGRGDIYGFVGENGSGKTTIIRMLTGLIKPTNGTYRLFGVENQDPAILQVRHKMGAVVESPAIYLDMTAKDNLKMQMQILGVQDPEKVQKTLELVGLGELYSSKKTADKFSLGMRQRLGIAMALLGDPEFLILDEPMNGLDPAGIVEIRELILNLNHRGITFMISSHILTELSLVATKYGIISKGKLQQEITAKQLRENTGKSVLLRVQDPDALAVLIENRFPDSPVSVVNGEVKISGEVNLNQLMKVIADSDNLLEAVNCKETGIEEYYISVIGGGKHA